MRLAFNNGTGWLKTLVACSFSGPPGVGLPGAPPPLPAPVIPFGPVSKRDGQLWPVRSPDLPAAWTLPGPE